MENLIVHDDTLCRLRVREEGDSPPAGALVRFEGLGWIEVVPIRRLVGRAPAARPGGRRAGDRSAGPSGEVGEDDGRPQHREGGRPQHREGDGLWDR